jgi:hypothetical protein
MTHASTTYDRWIDPADRDRIAAVVSFMLLERPHAIEVARAVLARAGCADRAVLIPGDFTYGIADGGDVYVLSRVLHDWDDQQCRALLQRCAEALPAQADLRIVKRLLPEDAAPSLSVAWDLHMRCTVGGRERTVRQDCTLLAASGFALSGQLPPPLDAALLRARPAGRGAVWGALSGVLLLLCTALAPQVCG